jgi:PAS domain S-box-containing protein
MIAARVTTIKTNPFWLFMALFLLLMLPVRAQRTITLVDSQEKYQLGKVLEILEDPEGVLSIRDVISPLYDSQFKPSSGNVLNYGFTRSVYWVRFAIKNEASFRSPWVLELDFPNMHHVDFYALTPGGEITKTSLTGVLRPLKSRDIIFQNMVFTLVMPRDSKRIIYARFSNQAAMFLRLLLWSTDEFTKKMQISNIFVGIFIGILLITAGYNLFLFFSLKDRSYMYYSLLIMSLLLFILSYSGVGAIHIWPNMMWLNLWSVPLSNALMLIGLLKFTDSFLQLRMRLKRFHLAAYILIIAVLILTIMAIFAGYHFIIFHLVVMSIVCLLLILGAGLISYQQGFKPAMYFILGVGVVIISGISITLSRLKLLSGKFFFEQGFILSIVVLIWMLSQALADRIKLLRIDKEKADRELKQSEERIRILSRAMEQSPALVIITDLEGNIEYVNPKFREITGYSAEEVIGKNPRILKSGRIPDSVYKTLWKTITSGQEWQGEFLNRKKNGDLYWESAYICPIKNESGEISHYLGLKEDVTEQKRLHEQLMQAQKMESIGSLAGGIAHDFNNILTVIKGYSDVIIRRIDKTHPLYKDISLIRSAGEKAENLTRQILAFSRKQIYQPQIIDINQVIVDMEKMMRRMIGEDINIEMSLESDLPRIKADPSQIEQIFVNLLINARDAIHQNPANNDNKLIMIETGQTFLDREYVRRNIGSQYGLHVYFSVGDTGIGMSEDTKLKIFDPFFTTKDRGTGLGLATIYGIVKQNSGHIFVYSEMGKGSRFKIYWPVSEDDVTMIIPEETWSGDLTGDETILVVEDDREVAKFVYSALSEAGYRVLVAENGKDALKLITKNKTTIDLLMTDLVMPDMNGKDLSKKIREKLPHIPVLFTSGYSDDLLVTNGQLEKNVNFLPKPYTVTVLLKKIRQILDG